MPLTIHNKRLGIIPSTPVKFDEITKKSIDTLNLSIKNNANNTNENTRVAKNSNKIAIFGIVIAILSLGVSGLSLYFSIKK